MKSIAHILKQGFVCLLALAPHAAFAQYTQLHDFNGASDGGVPTYTRLVCDGTMLYGMASRGGANDRGVVFKISSDGASFTKLHDFGLAPDGDRPFGSLYHDGTFLYGMTLRGGTNSDGTIFKIKTDGTGYVKIFDLNGVATGSDPVGSLISDGTYLYGITGSGGASGLGSVFKILPDGTGFVKLHDFPLNDGGSVGDLVLIGTTLYGTTFFGGADNDGTIFRIETDGTGFTTIHEFGTPDGIAPYTGALIYDGTFLYGTTQIGGTFDDGIIFKIKPDGTGYVDLHNFQTPTSGIPLGGLERVGGTLYGLTNGGGAAGLGTLFKINSDGSGYQTLMEFDGVATGYDVLGTLCFCGDGLYGMTAAGGTDDFGTIFKYTLSTSIPSISSFSPVTAVSGSTLTINGSNFSTTATDNIVFIGATRATVNMATATQLQVIVPVGATHDFISVGVIGKIAYSATRFLPTYSGGAMITACSFTQGPDVNAGNFPTSVKISDLNGDGISDLAMTNVSDATISVVLANGTNGFSPKTDYATEVRPVSLVVSDLDADGTPDLLSADDNAAGFPPNYVSVLLASGGGAFGTKKDYEVGHSPQYLALADVNEDGYPDLVVPNSNITTMSILPGTGSGSFGTKTDITIDLGANSVVVIDANKDGHSDLVMTNYFDNDISLFFGDGLGGFGTKTDFPTGTGPSNVAAGDLNNDGNVDVVVANFDANTISVLLGTGVGSFGLKTDYATGTQPGNVALGDLNGDGILDVAVANRGSNTVSLLQGNGNGTLVAKVDLSAGTSPYSVSIGDLNQDDKPDLVVANAGSNTISVLYNTVAPGPIVTSFSPMSGPVGTTVSISGSNFSSNIPDNIVYFGATQASIVSATASSLEVLVPIGSTYEYIAVTKSCLTSYSHKPFMATFQGNGIINSTTFGTKTDFATGSRPADVHLADFDGDGKADIVTVNDLAGSISLLRNTSSGTGIYSFAAKIDLAAGSSTQGAKVADIDGDGKLDVINVSDGTAQVCIHRNISTAGSISFQNRVSFTTGSAPIYVDFGDLDGDGRTDLAVVNRNSNTVSIYRNTGTKGVISFSAKQDFAVGAFPSGVAIGDIDGDGKPEVLTANRSAGTVSIFRNVSTSGAISLAARVDLTSGAGANGVAVGDLDGDGKMDIAVTNYTARTVSVFRNNSVLGSITPASFDARADFSNSATVAPTYISFGDVNGDNRPDILVANDAGTLTQVHQNISTTGSLTTSSFATRIDFLTGTRPHNVTSGDLDGDGRPEIVAANGSSNTVSVLHNILVPLPAITSFAPASGPIGTTVVITGANFSATPANNKVSFGATKATVTGATATQLTVIVPAGATYEPISVLVNSLTAFSARPFVVTFAGGGAINTCSFESKIDFITGSGPFFVSASDFDGDGMADLAVTNYTSGTASVFRNASSGAGNISFAAKVDFTAGSNPVAIAAADLDADGKTDLVVANSGLGTAVSVFRNTSSGTGNINFATKIDFTTGANPGHVSIGDLDRDGKPDLAVANFSSSTVSVFRNTSSGVGNISFAAKVDFTTGAQPNSVSIADVDGDDKADLAVVNLGSGTVSLLRNTSNGPGSLSFAARIDFVTGNTPRLVSIGDLDGDDKADLMVANDGSNTITVLQNSSNGPGDISYSAESDVVTGSGPRVVSIGDLDGDGKADLTASNQNDNNLSTYRNTSNGLANINFATKVDFSTGARPFSVSIADLDADGKADLIATNFNDASFSVLRNTISVPVITSFTPSGELGASVNITGINFDATPANNIVSFNGTAAVVTASTPTSITTTVPIGATTGPITITVSCNTTTSATDFTIPTAVISISVNGLSQADGSTITYSSLVIGNNEIKDFVIENSGTATLSISDIQVTGDFAISGPIPTSIPAGEDDILSIEFSPTVDGTRTGTLTFFSNGNIPAYVINLSGTGMDQTAVIEITESAVTLGNGSTLVFSAVNVGSELLKDLLITNAGNTSLSITDIQTTGDFSFDGAIPPLIEPGLDATVTIRFTPTLAGARTGTLTILSNADIPTYLINLSGTAVNPTPIIEVTEGAATLGNGSNLDFSKINVGSEELKDVVITNSGNATLVITDITITGDFALESDIPPAIAPQASETISIRFTPTALGVRTGTLTILSNGNTPVFDINLRGEGETEIEVYNVVTATRNERHDFLKIKNITFFPENKVIIFDRWGNKVFEINQYNNVDNVFKGSNDKGRDLPEGTYYYVIDKNNGDKPFTGFILLRR